MNNSRALATFILICTAALMAGCASGTGINRRQFFDNTAFAPLPFKVSLDNSINDVESSAAVRKENVAAATAMFGVGGALGGSQGYVDTLRGKFQAGKAIEESIISLGIQNKSKCLVHFHLNKYQYRTIPKAFQAEMEIVARFDMESDTRRSVYVCDMMPSSLMFTPGVEKDMQREIVEAIISHWGKQFVLAQGGDAQDLRKNLKFPPAARGEFSGKGAKCSYEVFVTP